MKLSERKQASNWKKEGRIVCKTELTNVERNEWNHVKRRSIIKLKLNERQNRKNSKQLATGHNKQEEEV